MRRLYHVTLGLAPLGLLNAAPRAGAVGIGGAEFHLAIDVKGVYTRLWAKNAAGLPTETFFGFVRHKDKLGFGKVPGTVDLPLHAGVRVLSLARPNKEAL